MIQQHQAGEDGAGARPPSPSRWRGTSSEAPRKTPARSGEAILATRIEEARQGAHPLPLPQPDLPGSGACRVEAAARIYFDKHVEELTLGESAILAGLPQRPPDYSPHRHWDKAGPADHMLHQMVESACEPGRGRRRPGRGDQGRESENPIGCSRPYHGARAATWSTPTASTGLHTRPGGHHRRDLRTPAAIRSQSPAGVAEFDKQLGWRWPLEAGDNASAIQARRDAREQAMRGAGPVPGGQRPARPLPAKSSLREARPSRRWCSPSRRSTPWSASAATRA
ncbi:MAG: transglycosylase domain-containing protein [Alphaproteobacteria bacterium]|nr:transglycosylase domain-containing protein [Alphaproteobacteria bacterium]